MSRSQAVLWALGAGLGAALAVAGVAVSQQGASVVEQRQAVMKHVGQEMKEAAALGSPTTFDAAKVKAVMDGVAADANKLKGLYPAGSDADPKTAADPKIWQNKADFDKRLGELAGLAGKAGKATTVDAYRPAFGAMGVTCKSCHDIYRKKKTA